MAAVARLRGDWRIWSWAWLHLAGFDAGEMVSGSPRHGDRHGNHGVRWWRDDRRPAGQHAPKLFQDPNRRWRVENVSRHGCDLFLLHDDRSISLSNSTHWLAPRRV